MSMKHYFTKHSGRIYLFLLSICFSSLSFSQVNKPVIAVGEITSAVAQFNTLSIQLALENALTKTNKFTIMERTRLETLLQERGLSIAGITDGDSSIGGFSGVDYLIYGSVSNVTIERKNLFIILNCDATLSMNIRVVDVGTGEIRFSENVTVEETVGTSGSDGDPCRGISLANINILGEDATDGIANKLTMSIFPIKVARVSDDGEVYLNYGEGTLSIGDILTIKLIGEGFLDPDTGEVLGAEETTTAVIVTNEVRSSFTIGSIVASNDIINVGDTAYFLSGGNSTERLVKQCLDRQERALSSCDSSDDDSRGCTRARDRAEESCGELLDL